MSSVLIFHYSTNINIISHGTFTRHINHRICIFLQGPGRKTQKFYFIQVPIRQQGLLAINDIEDCQSSKMQLSFKKNDIYYKVQASLFLLNDCRFLLPPKNALFSINHRVVGFGNVFLAFIKMTFYLKAIADSFYYQKYIFFIIHSPDCQNPSRS